MPARSRRARPASSFGCWNIPALHRRRQRQGRRPARSRPFPSFPHRGGSSLSRPGQRVAYVMLDLRKRGRDDALRRRPRTLDHRRAGAVQRSANREGRRRMGGAQGPGWARETRSPPWRAPAQVGELSRRRLQRGAGARTFRHHAVRNPAAQFGVTSLVDLGLPVTMADADAALRASFWCSATDNARRRSSGAAPTRGLRRV